MSIKEEKNLLQVEFIHKDERNVITRKIKLELEKIVDGGYTKSYSEIKRVNIAKREEIIIESLQELRIKGVKQLERVLDNSELTLEEIAIASKIIKDLSYRG